MNALERLMESSFHDAALEHVMKEGRNITLTLVECSYDRKNFFTTIIEMKNVVSVQKMENQMNFDDFVIEGQFGSVLNLELSEDSALLLLYWEDFSPARTEFAEYKFSFDSFSGTVMPAPPP